MSNRKIETDTTPPTIITLTLPTPEGGGIAPERATATLLIQRGELAHVRQFHYQGYLPDLMDAIREAHEALGQVEENPPVIPDTPKPQPKAKTTDEQPPATDEEPTIDIPLRKGTKAVKFSHLKIIGGETDAAAYRQAALIAGKLIDGGLWDGESPIRIDDVYAVAKKMKHLTDKDFSLFTLEDFVQVGNAEQNTPEIDEVAEIPDDVAGTTDETADTEIESPVQSLNNRADEQPDRTAISTISQVD